MPNDPLHLAFLFRQVSCINSARTRSPKPGILSAIEQRFLFHFFILSFLRSRPRFTILTTSCKYMQRRIAIQIQNFAQAKVYECQRTPGGDASVSRKFWDVGIGSWGSSGGGIGRGIDTKCRGKVIHEIYPRGFFTTNEGYSSCASTR